MKIILASNSPRRKELLKEHKIEFDVIPSNVDEKLNKDLGEYALEETTEYVINEERRIKREKESLIEEMSKVLGLLQEERSILVNSKEERYKEDTKSALQVCKTGMSMLPESVIPKEKVDYSYEVKEKIYNYLEDGPSLVKKL